MQFTKATTFRAASTIAVLGLVAGLTSQMVPSVSSAAAPATAALAVPAAKGTTAAAAVAAVTAAAPPKVTLKFTSDAALRAQMKWVPVRYAGEKTKTLDEASRLLLAQAAAERAGLDEVGLTFEDVYGVIYAETSWIPRDGTGKNGVSSLGLAQFEPRTARGLGLKNPHDPVQAVTAAAVNMKHGAEWAEDKIAHLKLDPEQRAAKIREGVSIYYNLSIKGRNKWNGVNTAKLPIETRRHIKNVRRGAERASDLAEDLMA
jgi:soluble lytic murein transglycosylase-like protein